MRRRGGFTLVELLVSMALIIFIMAILSESFSAGFKSFRDLKALGDMNERLRTASGSLRKYLEADHFEGRKRLSDPNFWSEGPPREGFFKIAQYTNAAAPYSGQSSYNEGSSTGIASYRSVSHSLHFTAKLRGNSRGEFFPANYAGTVDVAKFDALRLAGDGYRDLAGTYQAQWVEVAAFLRPTEIGLSEAGNSPGQLYALHLRTKALVPTQSTDLTIDANDATYGTSKLADFSTFASGGVVRPNTPADVTIPGRRMQYNVATAWGASPPTLGEENSALARADVLLSDVLSFNVRVLVAGQAEFYDLSQLDAAYPRNAVQPVNPAIFDTWTQTSQTAFGLPDYGNPAVATDYWNASPATVNSIPRYAAAAAGAAPIRIVALQIHLRVWDAKTEQTRQVTLVVDL